jgi:methionyl-tRNA formyltransferase
MVESVDSGSIIAVRRFPVLDSDTVYSITQRCYVEILHLFVELVTGFLEGEDFPSSTEQWKRKPYRRKQLDELCQLREDMSSEEIERRIKATTYGDKVWAYRVEEKAQA